MQGNHELSRRWFLSLWRSAGVCYNRVMTAVTVLLNPAAGGGRSGRLREKLRSELQRWGLDYRILVTRSEAHLRREVGDHKDYSGWLMIAGGDTTFRIAVEEILASRGAGGKVPRLAFFGTGSANDVMRGMGIRGIRHLLRLIRSNSVRWMDIGLVKTESPAASHCFLGSMSLGLGVVVNREMARTRGEAGRPLAAWLPGIMAMHRAFRGGGLPMELSVNRRQGEYSLAVVLNGPYYAGGLKLSPRASLFSQSMDLALLSSRGWITTLGTGVGLLAGRRRGLELETGTGWLLESPQPFEIQVDGDVFSAGRGCKIDLIPAALPVAAAGN